MALSIEELKAKILEKAINAPKPQLYVKDFYDCDPDAKPRTIKNAANDLVKEGKMDFWSSGSTTMYAAKGRAKDEEGAKGIN
ncbi:MAG: dissimilatory sulfite reductase D family protein [Desulfobulbaceae bacterium]|nr:dissimilatory sulfite reductase D family protein [Desulfobulbaceae bacterium]